MSFFRKKPVTVEAVPVKDALLCSLKNWGLLPDWVRQAYERGDLVFEPAEIHVHTLEGVMVAGREDWLIKGVKGEIYPCKADIFEATYEQVLDEKAWAKPTLTPGGRRTDWRIVLSMSDEDLLASPASIERELQDLLLELRADVLSTREQLIRARAEPAAKDPA